MIEVFLPLLILLALVAIPILAGTLFVVRRRAIARHAVISAGALRGEAESRWHSGWLALTGRALEWHPLVSLSLAPAHRWGRASVELREAVPLSEPPPWLVASQPDLYVVRCESSGRECTSFSVIVSIATYKALRSWIESSPPVDSRWEF